MCTCYPIINRVSELKVHIELTRFVQPEKIEIDANEREVNEKSQYCFFVCTTFDSFLNYLLNSYPHYTIKITALHITINIQCRYLYFLQCTRLILPYDNIISDVPTAWFRWSRRESNPCPKTYPLYFYERSLYINIPSGSPVQTRYCF